ncbi:hypothetical protein [Fodinicola acaciae]|uniref:hypothetical protein n=1 Tax=Fodinicola acaciae TaxID=2681555 RepID=UPI0013D693DD|nr:hypothetical protein [Fodinicola acaciae]
MRIQADFGMLQAAQHNVRQALSQIQQESDNWQRVLHQLAPDLADATGATSSEVHQAWAQMHNAHQHMLQLIDGGMGKAHNELHTAVASSVSRLRNVQI